LPGKVVITDRPLKHVDLERSIIERAKGTLEVYDVRRPSELCSVVSDADVVMVNLSKLDRIVIRCMKRARGIVRYGVGYDNIDVGAATERGIMVANVPSFCAREVAEFTLALMLAVKRRLLGFLKYVESGQYVDTSGWKQQGPITSLSGKTVGIVGFGRIGREVARRLSGFDVEILVHDPYLDPRIYQGLPFPVRVVSLDELLASSDVVTLHVPLSEETRGLIGRDQLSMMKRTAYLINVSRGGIVDEDALADAVRSGIIAGAAVDTLSREPPNGNNPLIGVEGILVTPHVAWYTEESILELEKTAARQAAQILAGETPDNLVNPEVLR